MCEIILNSNQWFRRFRLKILLFLSLTAFWSMEQNRLFKFGGGQ